MKSSDSLRALGIGNWHPSDHLIQLDQDAQSLLESHVPELSLLEFAQFFQEADFLSRFLREHNEPLQNTDHLTLTLANSEKKIRVKLSSPSSKTWILTFLEFGIFGDSPDVETRDLVLAHAGDMLTLHDKNGYIRYVSPSAYRLLGYMPEELMDTNPYEKFFHKDEVEYIQKYLHEAILNGKESVKFQHRMLTKTGVYRWFETHAEAIFDEEGNLTLIQSTSRDISDQKETESFLEETNEIALVGGWQYFPHSNKLEWTNETYRLHELPIGAPITIEDGINYYHPDYRNTISKAVNNLIQTGEPYDVEAFLITEEGNERWVRTNGSAVWNRDGTLNRIRGVIQDISDQKLIEQQLRFQEKRNQDLVETVQDIIFWVDLEGYFVDINPMIYTITGFTQNELKGTHFKRIIPTEYQAGVQEWFQEVLTASNPKFNERIPILTKEQEWRWIDLNIQRRREDNKIQEVFGIARDVTAEMQTQQKLANNTQRLKTLVDNLQSGVLLEDEYGQVYLINQRFFDLFELPHSDDYGTLENRQALLARAIEGFESPTPETFDQKVQDIIQNQRTVNDYEVKLKSGRVLSMDTVPIYQDQGYLGHLWQYHDITREKRENQKLDEAKQEAEKASNAQADFLSTMSHEIRTPLNSVIGIAHILLDQNPRSDQLENLRALKFAGENLLNLINDILDFNKIEAGKIQLESRPFDLNKVIRGVYNTHAFKAEEKGLKLYYHFDDTISNYLKGDPTRTSQIVNNLLSNAIKFTEEGYIYIKIQKTGETQKTENLYFEIQDTGPGIPDESQNEIFKSFSQASTASTRNYGGTGLGISITQRLLDLYNSELKLSSTLGKGTSFHFKITMEKADTSESSPSNESTSEKAQSLAGYHILIAEDNQMNTFMARQFLEKWGLTITVVVDGQQAVQAASIEQYDLILMDLQMPEMDGYEAAMQIRRLKGYATTPIIALTASAFAPLIPRVLEYQMNDALTKPFDPEFLYTKLQQYLIPGD